MTYTTIEDELQRVSSLVAFRAPANLVAALDKATADDMCSRSDVARRALLDHLRERGLIPEVGKGIQEREAADTISYTYRKHSQTAD